MSGFSDRTTNVPYADYWTCPSCYADFRKKTTTCGSCGARIRCEIDHPPVWCCSVINDEEAQWLDDEEADE